MARTVKKSTKKEEVKVTPVVETVAEEAVVEVKEEAKKAPAKKTATKKAAEEKATEEKAPAKKTAAKKEAVNVSVTLQFAEKSYTEETLVNIAKDVWKFDLNQNEEDLKTVELYVKPEEGLCYYVFNGDVTGSFVI